MSSIVCVCGSDNLSDMREFLDFVLGISAFNEDIAVIFTDKSLKLIHRIGDISPESVGERNFVKTFGMLELYGIGRIFAECENADDEALIESAAAFIPGLKPLSSGQCLELIRGSDHSFTF